MTLSLDIANLSRLYEAAETTPADVIREVYRRIAAKGVAPDWITLVDEPTALKRAAAAPRGPLYGIPFAIKDNIDLAGIATTCACPEFAYVPKNSAFVVARLEAAGAIAIGKTNLDQFATGLVGTRSPYGIPTSPFNAAYISGGSSSGSAVAVASGLVSFALGTDTAGSGRVPAGFNNIVGLKPTKGLFSTTGVVPACRTQDTVSIFALTVADAAAAAAVMAGYDASDPYARPHPSGFTVGPLARGLRIGVPADGLSFFGDDEYARLYDEAIARMANRGATIVRFDFEPFRQAASLLYDGPWVAERLAAVGDLATTNPLAIHEVVRGIILGAAGKSAVSAFEGFYRLAELTRAAERAWSGFDVMLLPTAGTTYTIADVLADPVALNSNLGRTTNFVNLMDLSALAIPAGFRRDGIPFGVTLVGRAFDDGVLAALGDKLHRALGNDRIGATGTCLGETPELAPAIPAESTIDVAVVGAHLLGQPLNWQLSERNARLVETTRTAAGYRLYALAGTVPAKPGLVFDRSGPGAIEVEIWQMDPAAFGSFVALIPAPLGIGTLRLADGRSVKGFLCEAHAVKDAEDITNFGGWRSWLARTAVA